MTGNINSTKYELISEITEIESEKELAELEQHVKLLRARREFGEVIRPTRDTVSVEMLKQEQDYQPVGKAEFDALVTELNISESIEELLEMVD